jgi:hypothetical protein
MPPWAATVWLRVGKTLVMAGGLQTRRAHAERGAQTGATGTHHHHIVGMVNESDRRHWKAC